MYTLGTSPFVVKVKAMVVGRLVGCNMNMEGSGGGNLLLLLLSPADVGNLVFFVVRSFVHLLCFQHSPDICSIDILYSRWMDEETHPSDNDRLTVRSFVRALVRPT